MLQSIESLIPIMVLVGLGASLFKWGFISSEVRAGLDQFTYWVALPSLFIHRLSGTDFRALDAGDLVLVLVATVLATTVLAGVVAAALRLSRDEFGVFIQVGFRGNMVFVGLPLVIFAMHSAPGGADLVSSALIALAALVPLNNLIAVVALIMSRQGLSLAVLGRLIIKIVTNPLIISALIGGAFGLLGWSLPTVIDRPFELLGQTAIALALVSLGGALIELEIRGRIGRAITASCFKVAAVPAVAYGFCRLWDLPADQTLIVMIFCACPSATVSYILTTELGGDDALAAASIIISTLLSFVSLAIVLALF